ncbi:membrane protein [Gordonia neofelifaecis NRRL B-59395]|uniref:Membrane protein n=2 Tax=Gordonia TaxID=2053 RepID=F1YGW6_9ACTN|nr:membrane protein [Gordonia neofelifaecis NRRL B-59395]
MTARLRRLPLRLATGAFIVNSGVGKLGLDEQSAAGVQAMAANAFPPLKSIPPGVFGKLLAGAEISIGAALLAPVVPAAVAGAALTAFSAGLLTMYVRTPEMHEDGSLRPTQQGTAVAKDSWLLGIGASLLVDAIVSGECRADCGRADSEPAADE